MTSVTDDDLLDLSAYRVQSRREIVSLLRSLGQRNQLIRVQSKSTGASAVTAILHVDEASDEVIIDTAPSALTTQRILDSEEISFDTTLENIRILFFAAHAESCIFEDRPALRIAVPQDLIRLQRREFYRVAVPVVNPVKCTFTIPGEPGGAGTTVTLPLYNVSAGGIAVVDDKLQIDPEYNTVYENCRLDLPGGPLVVTLQFRNSHEISLANRKQIRRLGFRFVDMSNAGLAAIQRFITKLEREQNARKTGLA